MNNKHKDAEHRTSKDARLCVSNIAKAILITLTLAYTGLSAQSKGFNDTVILKNGTVLNGVKAVVTKDSLVVTTSEGETSVFTKKEVSEVKKGGGGNGEKPVKTDTKSSKGNGKWSEYQGKMDFETANRQCVSLSMRLPTLEDLKAAYASGISKTWTVDGGFYWSSSTLGNDRAYYLFAEDGDIGISLRVDRQDVRCIR